jgi:hypothetical protein
MSGAPTRAVLAPPNGGCSGDERRLSLNTNGPAEWRERVN